jgi:hypothetical protein
MSASFSLVSKKNHPEQSRIDLQDTLQTASSFTGYLATQLYTPPVSLSFRAPGVMTANSTFSAKEELRREIRALKGLVLNRSVVVFRE